jgi:ABC-type multidrug transport system fused ATPase/permease subunit
MKLLWRLAKEASKYKVYYIIAIVSTLLMAGIGLVGPKVLASLTGVIADGMDEADLKRISFYVILLVSIYLIRGVCRFLSNYLAHKAAWNLVNEMRVKLYGHMQISSLSFFHESQTGDLMSRVINDTATFELLFAHIIPDIITNIVTVAGVVAILLLVNWQLALMTFIPIPFLAIAGYYFIKKIRPNFRKAQKAVGELNSKLQDNFSGIHEVQAFGQEQYEYANVENKARSHTTAILYALKKSAIFHPVVDFLTSMGTVLIVGAGGLLAFRNQMTVEDIVAFMLYLSLFYQPVMGLARTIEDAQQAYAGAERVLAIMDKEPLIKDLPDAVPLRDVKGDITFEDVTFSYKDGVPVLKNISFHCEAGQTIALVGPTGVGKTTLVNLISRYYEPSSGKIFIDGQDIRHVTLASLRRAIAPVLQETFLFNDTIAENIRYAKPDADLGEIKAAARLARIDDEIEAMPDGFDTKVGERGVKLSGGQKQRIAIARAILRDAPIVILDEATASVDNETEKKIQEAIGELSKKRTIIAIAHRLSTIRGADKIIVLENGRIAETGSHAELIMHDGLYRRLTLAERANAGTTG